MVSLSSAQQSRQNAQDARPLNGYIAFVEGVKHEIHAPSLFAASQAARALYKGRKKYPRVSVDLCEIAGQQVTSYITN